MQVGGKSLVKEEDDALAKEKVHSKLDYNYWAGPWAVKNVGIVGISYGVMLQGR